MTSKSPMRTADDIDEVALSYAEIKALAAENPYIKEKMDLDVQVSKLQLLKQSFLNQKYELEDKVTNFYPKKIREEEGFFKGYEKDIALTKKHTPVNREEFPPMEICGAIYTEKQTAGNAILAACKSMKSPDDIKVGVYRGMELYLRYNTIAQGFEMVMQGALRHCVSLDRHIEWAEVCEETLYKRANEYEETTEEQVIRRLNVEKLHTAILALPEMQRRRVVRYYFLGMTYKKIAEIEHSSVSSVARSILAAKRAVKRLLE